MKEKKKLLLTVLGVVIFIVTIAGITYAAFGWVTDPNTGYIGGTSDCFNISYVKGDDILDGSLSFGTSYTDGLSVTVSAGLDTNCNIEQGIGTLYLNTDDITSDELLGILRYQVLDNGTPVDGASGIVTSKGNTPVYSNFNITTEVHQYTVYIWVDINDINDSNMSDIMTSSYSGSVSMTAESR